MPVPETNPLTPGKVALGRRLFFDKSLSRDGTVACASCHDPERAFSDGRPVAIGVFGRQGHRSAPALINRGYGRSFFWDARVVTLRRQSPKHRRSSRSRASRSARDKEPSFRPAIVCLMVRRIAVAMDGNSNPAPFQSAMRWSP